MMSTSIAAQALAISAALPESTGPDERLALVERTSSVTSRAAEALADGRVDADERGELLPLIV